MKLVFVPDLIKEEQIRTCWKKLLRLKCHSLRLKSLYPEETGKFSANLAEECEIGG